MSQENRNHVEAEPGPNNLRLPSMEQVINNVAVATKSNNMHTDDFE